jgi:hypothetical protein
MLALGPANLAWVVGVAKVLAILPIGRTDVPTLFAPALIGLRQGGHGRNCYGYYGSR